MEREAMFNYFNLPRRDIPSQPMVSVKNPFDLKLKSTAATTAGDHYTDIYYLCINLDVICLHFQCVISLRVG